MVALRAVVASTELGIRVVAGEEYLDGELTGAHASEQKDPTPWLGGGELLMIDGLNLGRSRHAQEDYLQRLKDKGVCALALGVGGSLPYKAVPTGLINAAVAAEMPLLEVPVTTPFIAITQLVYSQMADERLAITERTLDGQRQLTAAASTRDALSGIAAVLGSLIDGWAAVCDPLGVSLLSHEAPPIAIDAIHRHTAELTRGGLHVSVTAAEQAGTYVIQPLGVDRARALLIYGRDRAPLNDRLSRNLAIFTAALLSIEVERRHAVRVLERRPGADVIARLLAGVPPARATQLLAAVGIRAERIHVLAVSSTDSSAALVDALADAVPEALLRPTATGLRAILPSGVPGLLERLEHALGRSPAGLGGPVHPHHTPASHRQAEHALTVSRQRGEGLVDAMHLGSVQLLLQLGSADALAAFADAILSPIERRTGPQNLHRSLQAYLATSGNHDQAAALAGVHRHTLRRHLHRIEELTGRRLDTARDRTEFWLAFEARDAITTL